MEQNIEDIDLSSIDWNKLSIPQFQAVEASLQKKNKEIKKQKRIDSVRNSGYTQILLKGNYYSIKTILFQRLKSMKSEKCKEKLISEIISQNNPIESL
jgi:hypothetical protein